MTGERLRLRLRASRQGPVVWAAGRLSESTMETFLRVVAAALRTRGTRAVALELGEVVYIDVAGVAALLECRRLARDLGCDLVLAQVSPQVRAGIRACAACSLVAGRIEPRRCGMRRRRRLPPGDHGGRVLCGRLPHGRRPISHERSQAE